MEFGVLGPLSVTTAHGEVDLGGARQRRLLAALLAHAGQIVSLDRLTDMVFEGDPPRSATTTMRSYVARLRRSLAAADDAASDLVVTEQRGYGLRIELDHLDAARFEASIEMARSQLADRDAIGAAAILRDGLELWRGNAYGEFAHEEWAHAEATRLNELKTVAQEELNDSLLACGLASDVVSATRGLVAEHPLRERLRAQHMLALYRAGRQVEALRSLDDYQAALIDVGLEPSPELRALGGSIAAHDPALRLDSPAGQPLRGYRIGAAIGEGAHGVVYRAVQPGVGREVAVKTIRAQLADDPDFIRGFDAEAQLVANLEHPHIVPIYDYWREPGGAYIVMRLLDGNLGARVADGPLGTDAVASIARQLGSALVTAHRAGVIHGDIKPTNVLVDDDDVYLADFGVASLVESTSDDRAPSPSSGFESPEILAGQPASTASDQFALAVLFFQLLTGTLPFGNRAIATVHDRSPAVHVQRPSVPVAIDEVLWRATAWQPGERFATVEAFIAGFLAALEGRDAVEHAGVHPVVNPYKGLEAFTEADQANFHGRRTVVDELVAQVARPGQDGRFVVAVGASGSGKSSVVRAGLVPRLRSGALDGSERWLYATMVPGSDPFAALQRALRPIASAAEPGLDAGVDGHDRFRRLIRDAVPEGQPLLLVIDQLEELFTLVPDEDTRRLFLDGLTDAVADARSGLRVAATFRADFLDRPLRYADFGQLVKHGAVTIVGMSASEIAEAVTHPAASMGVEVEPALVSELVADVVDQPAALPLLQFALTELFDRGSVTTRRVMTLSDYRELGGVEAAVARRADAAVEVLPEADRDRARRVFLRLVNVDDDNTVSRRRTHRSQLTSRSGDPSEVEGLLSTFGDARLLTFDHDTETREPTVELAHEALIQHWPRFRHWVRDAGESLRVHQQVAAAALVWEENSRDDGDLARGLRLETALELAANEPDNLDPLEREFVAASQRLRTAEADAQRERIEREERSNRRLRGLLAGVALLLVVALVAGFFALGQRNDARAANTEAGLAKLISDSAAATADDPELAILLALEAHRRSPEPATEQAVLNALGRSEIGSRVATFEPIEPAEGCPGLQFDQGFLAERVIADGRYISRDLTSGEITDHGSAPAECGNWLVDPLNGRAVVETERGARRWVGTVDDPAATEITDLHDGILYPVVIAGNRFAATVDGNAWTIHDATNGEQIGTPTEVNEVYDVVMHPAADYLVLLGRAVDADDGNGIGRLHLVDARIGAEIDTIDTERFVGGVAFDDETDELVVAVEGVALRTYDTATGDLVAETPLAGTSEVRSVSIRPDDAVVVASLGQVDMLDRRTGPVRQPVDLRDASHALARPDGTVLTVRSDGRMEVVDVGSRPLTERAWPIPDQAQVSINAGQAGVYDAFGLGAPEVIDLHSGERSDVAVAGVDEGTPIVWVYPEEQGSWTIFADGTMVLRRDGEVVHRLDAGMPINTGTRVGNLLGLVSNRDGEALVSIVDLAPDAPGVVFQLPATDISTVHPSVDGGLHVLALDGTLTTYDSAGEFVSEFDTGAGDVRIVTLDPETDRLAVGTRGGVVLIDTITGETDQLQGGEAVTNLGFARNGSMLVITGADGTVRLWDLERDAPAGLVWDGTGSVFSSPSWYDPETDSVWVATSGLLMEVPLDPQRWVQQACELVGRDLTADEWGRWVPDDGPPQSACG
jgi:DNA-binding SARP family transcriptional activator/WD40 repeat protein/predicted Ser/Thr protein kinase